MQGDLELQLDNAIPTPEDEERIRIREEYRQRLAEKLKDPEFRKIEGFPIGTDEAILALSDPPYYTACPNPFIEEWLQQNAKPYDPETDDYHREPFAADVSEGKNDPIYNAHSYHTKVPHKAIMRYILHYTEPGDVVYDGFCGTGMTGVAAFMCGNRNQVESLGYKVLSGGLIEDSDGKLISKIGERTAIVSDLSPAASFIAYNYNTPLNANSAEQDAKRIILSIEKEYGWLYATLNTMNEAKIEQFTSSLSACKSNEDIKSLCSNIQELGRINYVVWSDILICPNCGNELIYWDLAVERGNGRIKDTFSCPSCNTETTKRFAERSYVNFYDTAIDKIVQQPKQIPVLINYNVGKKRQEKRPDAFDILLVEKINNLTITDLFPIDVIDIGDKTTEPLRIGLTHIHHLYTKRNLILIAKMWNSLPNKLRWIITAHVSRNSTRFNRFIVNKYNPRGRINGPLTGTLYIPSEQVEQNVIDLTIDRVKFPSWNTHGNFIAIVGLQEQLLPHSSIDYIFTDPPFGGNFMYSELNSICESWINVHTSNKSEAIANETQKKGLREYQMLMTDCFKSYYNALKPGRFMTVEFHNSSNAVWNSIQEGLQAAGFIVADVRTLDKGHGGVKAAFMINTVSQDLIITAYKPLHSFETRFQQTKGQIEGVVEFILQHLDMLPVVPISKDGKIELVAERTKYMLFDRMVAYHLQQGARIPISAAEFYQMLYEQFVERDDMYFLPDQASKYDALRSRKEMEQLSIFIRDERSAVQWARTQLLQSLQTLGELTPKFMQETRDWESHEPRPELRDILKENFIVNNEGKWRIPDPNQEKDLEALRLKGMLKTFENYVKTNGQLKIFRKEAIVEGFKHCWHTKQFGVIVALCERIPAKILQEVPEFIQFYDIVKDLAPVETAQLEFSWDG
jgi:hypothetical protein